MLSYLLRLVQAPVHEYKGLSNPQMEGAIKVQIPPLGLESLVVINDYSFGGGNVLSNNVNCSMEAGLAVPGEAATPKPAQMSHEMFKPSFWAE